MQYLLVLAGSVLIVDAVVGDKGVLQMLKKRQDSQRLVQELAAARQRNAQLLHQIDRIKHDPDAVEEMARRKLRLIKPGEKLFIIRDAPPADERPGDK